MARWFKSNQSPNLRQTSGRDGATVAVMRTAGLFTSAKR
jgi:hypothetical protein